MSEVSTLGFIADYVKIKFLIAISQVLQKSIHVIIIIYIIPT